MYRPPRAAPANFIRQHSGTPLCQLKKLTIIARDFRRPSQPKMARLRHNREHCWRRNSSGIFRTRAVRCFMICEPGFYDAIRQHSEPLLVRRS